MALGQGIALYRSLSLRPEALQVFLRRESRSDFDLLAEAVEVENTPDVTAECSGTYDPSGRRDSGITRSRVRGSSAMPAAVVSGKMGGLDMGCMRSSESER